MTFTVVFDRSAFHRARFDLLSKSALLPLTKCGAITVHHSDAFLEETISMYVKEKNHTELRRQLPYILEICNGRWFRATLDIWDRELRLNQGVDTDVFEEEPVRTIAQNKMLEAVARGGEWPEFKSALPEKDVERGKQEGFRRALLKMRRDIEAYKKSDRSLRHQPAPSVEEFIHHEIESFGAIVIAKHIATSYSMTLKNRWKAHKDRYPFFTTGLEGRAYAAWHAMVEHNKRIDPNAQVDVEMLTCLNRADAIVSADTRFQKDCFDVLWKPRGKLFLTPEEFAGRVNRMASHV
jgi:hypothetical protein